MHEQNQKFNNKIEAIKKNKIEIMELKGTMPEMKNQRASVTSSRMNKKESANLNTGHFLLK